MVVGEINNTLALLSKRGTKLWVQDEQQLGIPVSIAIVPYHGEEPDSWPVFYDCSRNLKKPYENI